MAICDLPNGYLFLKAYFFGLLLGSPVVSLQLQELPGYNLKPTPILREKGETKEADDTKLVNGRFNNQGHFHMNLILGGHKMSIFLYLPAKS